MLSIQHVIDEDDDDDNNGDIDDDDESAICVSNQLCRVEQFRLELQVYSLLPFFSSSFSFFFITFPNVLQHIKPTQGPSHGDSAGTVQCHGVSSGAWKIGSKELARSLAENTLRSRPYY